MGDPQTFVELWNGAIAARPDQLFLTFEGPGGRISEWTYAEFDVAVARAGKRLADLGLGAGGGLRLALGNTPSFLGAWLAALRLGAWLSTAELAPADPTRGPAPVIGLRDAAREVPAARGGGASIRWVVVDENDVDLPAFGEVELGDWPVPRPMDRAAIFSSTGPDEGDEAATRRVIDWTQANEAFAATTMAAAASLGSQHRVLVVLPLSTVLARSYSVAAAIAVGAHVVLGVGFDPVRLPEQIRRYRITHVVLDAAEVTHALPSCGDARAVTGSLEHCWCVPVLAAGDHDAFVRWLGCEPRGLFGTAETVAAVLTDRDEPPVPGSLGTVTPGCEVDVVDEHGRPVATGDAGELVARGEAGRTLWAGASGGAVRAGLRVRRDSAGRFGSAVSPARTASWRR